jgi:hypothetical protein
MHKSATKCNETIGKWCKNKHGASKIIDTFETYHVAVVDDVLQWGFAHHCDLMVIEVMPQLTRS